MNAITTTQCCTKDFESGPCRCKPGCSSGECVNVRGKCPMHCGCKQHGHENPDIA